MSAVSEALSPIRSTETGAGSAALIAAQERQLAQLGDYVMRLGTVVMMLEARMKAMEKQSGLATISHQQALALQRRIREKAAALCARYRLEGAKDSSTMRALIHKDVLKTHGIRNLHDLPQRALPEAERQIDGYLGYEAAKKIREKGAKAPASQPR